jgi:hypothetical protein
MLCLLLRHVVGLLDSIASLHKKNFIHGDIKPANIAWDQHNQCFVFIDFGIVVSKRVDKSNAADTRIICNGVRDPDYACPEEKEGIYGLFTDIYCLGRLLKYLIEQYRAGIPVVHPAIPVSRLEPILDNMVANDFWKRPTVQQVLDEVSKIRWNDDTMRQAIIKYLEKEAPQVLRAFNLDLILHKQGGLFKFPAAETKTLSETKTLWTLLVGNVQAGKSQFIKALALYYFGYGISTVIVVRNSKADYEQLRRGFENLICDFERESKMCLPLKVLNCKTKCEDSVKDALDRGIPSVFIALGNCYQIRLFNNCFTKASARYACIIDEVDNFYNNETEPEPQVNGEIKKPEPQVNGDLKNLEGPSRAGHVVGVTATGFGVMSKETQLTCRNVVILEPPPAPVQKQNQDGYMASDKPGYVGIPNIIKVPIDPPKIEKKGNMSGWVPFYAKKPEMPEPDRKDLPIQTRLPLGSQKIFQLDSDRTHPVMVLHECSHLVDEHDRMLKLFKSDPRLQNVWTVLTFNGEGIKLYSSKLVDDKIQLPGERKEVRKINGEFLFEEVGVSIVLQFLKENGGARRFGHIVIIAGKLAGRGINFVSQDFKWCVIGYILYTRCILILPYSKSLKLLAYFICKLSLPGD